ncbi:MAG: cAMP-binding proteins - catabolite gene activator and regulatory subunit of cAMP-dependent protein kinases, partial [uncultured Gemmatimonadaceae bacterium]
GPHRRGRAARGCPCRAEPPPAAARRRVPGGVRGARRRGGARAARARDRAPRAASAHPVRRVPAVGGVLDPHADGRRTRGGGRHRGPRGDGGPRSLPRRHGVADAVRRADPRGGAARAERRVPRRGGAGHAPPRRHAALRALPVRPGRADRRLQPPPPARAAVRAVAVHDARPGGRQPLPTHAGVPRPHAGRAPRRRDRRRRPPAGRGVHPLPARRRSRAGPRGAGGARLRVLPGRPGRLRPPSGL